MCWKRSDSCIGDEKSSQPVLMLTGTRCDIPRVFVSFHVRNVTLCFSGTFARHSAPLFCEIS